MLRNKLFTSINILGLSISLACCMLLFLYATQELSFDKHHEGEVYRLTSNLSQKDGEVFKIASSSIPIAPVIQEDIPEIELAVRVTGGGILGAKDLISIEDNSFYIENGYVADPSIFEIFKFDFISGDESNPLPFSNAIVLEKEWAIKVFGESIDPVGKTIKLSTAIGESDYEVTAIYDKSTYKSHLIPSYFISTESTGWNEFFDGFSSQWVGNNLVFTYLKLTPGSDPKVVNEKIAEIFQKHGAEEMKAIGLNKTMNMQPVEAIHTNSDFMINTPGSVNLIFIQVLVVIGVLILLLACVNYINLSTAQAGNRELEVGMRKVMGVSSSSLIIQFLGESFLVVLISMGGGIILMYLAIPFFNQLIASPLELSQEMLVSGSFYLLVFLVVTSLLAGIYPAIYLSSFKPAHVLKGKNRDKGSAALLRKILVVFQYVISIVLISSILIISQQVDFIKNKDLGFDPTTKVIVPLRTNESAELYATLKLEFASIAAVNSVSGSSAVPGSPIINDILVYKQGQTMDDAVHIYNNNVDFDYAQVLGMKLASGSYFTGYNQDTVSEKILINETAADQLALDLDDAVGEVIYLDWRGSRYDFEIVGVVKDINQFSLHSEITPLMFTLGSGRRYQFMMIDANLENFQGLISDLEDQCKEAEINTPFEYFTLNENLRIQYESDYKTFDLIMYFAIISIIISSLGLYAISMFVAERRFKEIGVRKALGARVGDILIMVSGDLSRLILFAFAISIPITIFGMERWLETFAYRVNPGVGTYLVAGLISVLIGWISMGYQSFRAASTNPVNVLRDE
ncbi:MAG: ABC transporter permease [Bacteroidetes bacterium]|nr:ABC transporter permease [Bacteroidota bacterium]